jgi:hypothetical protein
MPPKPSSASRVATRAKNVDTHPGLVQKRKRRTKAEIEADNKKAEEGKNAKKAKKMEGLKKIAMLEEMIDEADANDVTPRPKVPQRAAPLRSTSARTVETLFDDSASESLADNISDTNDYMPTDEPTYEPTDDLEATDVDEEQPVKKKVKQAKSKVRDTINAARKESMVQEEPEMREGFRIVDKTMYGKKAHEAAQFVLF